MSDADQMQAYGLWSLLIINSLVFIIFAFSFAKPRTSRDWRSFGAFSAFLVALFLLPGRTVERTGALVVGTQEVAWEDVERYGIAQVAQGRSSP